MRQRTNSSSTVRRRRTTKVTTNADVWCEEEKEV
jgi:hypothetical protein